MPVIIFWWFFVCPLEAAGGYLGYCLREICFSFICDVNFKELSGCLVWTFIAADPPRDIDVLELKWFLIGIFFKLTYKQVKSK